MAQPVLIFGGSTGLVGSALRSRLTDYRVKPLVRPQTGRSLDGIAWDPEAGQLDPASLEGAAAVIHLGGAGVADRRWSGARKRLIHDSRVVSTALLAQRLAALKQKPEVLLCASAIGIYGDGGAQRLNEQSPLADDYLAGVCRAWEAAAQPAVQAGIRVVHLRIGIVLATDGGALARMVPPFRMGMGGSIGSGQQYMSWIHLDDVVGALLYCLEHPSISGPVNLTAPEPQTNANFTKTLGRVLHRPAVLPLPGFMVNLLFGEMGRSLLLAGARVMPDVLQSQGYAFRHPHLEAALTALLA